MSRDSRTFLSLEHRVWSSTVRWRGERGVRDLEDRGWCPKHKRRDVPTNARPSVHVISLLLLAGSLLRRMSVQLLLNQTSRLILARNHHWGFLVEGSELAEDVKVSKVSQSDYSMTLFIFLTCQLETWKSSLSFCLLWEPDSWTLTCFQPFLALLSLTQHFNITRKSRSHVLGDF